MNNPRRIQRHLVKALAAGALLAAAALPMAIATEAGAAGTPPTLSSVTFTPHGSTTSSFGAGASGTVAFTGTGFANDGGAVALAATCTTGDTLTFTNEVETSSTAGTADFTSTGTVAGTCTITLTDDSSTTASNTVTATVDAAPTVSGIAPSTIFEGTGANTVTITGTGFETGATVSFTSTVNSTPLTSSVKTVTPTSITLSVTPTNSATNGAATAGGFTATVTNPDGGSASSASGALTVTYGIEDVSPSAVPLVTTATSTPITITGAGFEYGATVTATGTVCTGAASGDDQVSIANATVTSSSTITANLVQAAPNGTTGANVAAECGLTVQNPTVANGGNDATYTAANAIGIGEASGLAPTVTASNSATTALNAGAAATSVTLTGTGFSQYSTASTTTPGVTFGTATASTGTSITFPVVVASSGASAGPINVTVSNGTAASAAFSPVATVAGPTIASSSPAALAVGAPYGTTLTLTGTGFSNTITDATAAVSGSTGLAGVLSYASPTTLDFVVTTAPTSSGTADITVTEETASGVSVSSAPFALTVNAAPTVSSLTYATSTNTPAINEVGVGAKAATIYINGSGFETGATVTAFVNGSNVADPDVTATVTSVTPTKITATVAIAAGDTNFADGYTVTNPDGGVAKVSAIQAPLLIGAGPTITAVSPVTATPSSTNAFTITGTGFEAGAVVSASSDGTCGTATLTGSTSIAVSCTLGAEGTSPVTLTVTNPDGGSATSGTVLPAAVAKTAPAFKVTGAHGTAIAGKTSTLTISGSGFYGQPKITSTAPGTKVGVSHDSGTVLTIRVTTKAGVAGEHTFTIRLADGKSAKANYDIKK